MPIIRGNSKDRLVIPNFTSKEHNRELDIFRTPKIRTANGRFSVSKSPVRSYSITTHYPKVIVSQLKALKYAERERKAKRWLKPSKAKRPTAKIVVRTHNKEYTRRTEQAEALKSQTAKTRSEIRSQLFKMFREQKPLWRLERKEEITKLFTRLGIEIQQALEAEAFFQRKNTSYSARKTSDNRIKFIAQNANQALETTAFLEHKQFVESGFTQQMEKKIYETMPEQIASRLGDTNMIGNGRWQRLLYNISH